ncbi:MAG TPA: ATP-binding protein [Anaeromyxobacteraceae bacterium]|nr:ATP-binding protein [Anaeromyxobacteraceae bacterium]
MTAGAGPDRSERTLRVLMVEDREDDAKLVALALRRGGWRPEIERVDSADALRTAMGCGGFDVVIAEYALPRLNGLEALRIVRELSPDVPFVLVSATIGEEGAVEALKAGAGDFVTKQNLARLSTAVEREIADAQLRRERRETLDALRQAVAARDQFLNIASHELKTPLTALQLQLQSLSRSIQDGGAGSDRVSAKIRTLSRSTDRLGELVNRLLDVSNIAASGHVNIVREDMDLAELVHQVGARFERAAAEAGSQLRIDAAAPARGSWDRMRLDAMVTSLVANALKYGPGRPIDLAVAAPDPTTVRLTVRDHGIGIAPADQARIFERFERAVPERHYGGFGLGLWVARLVVEEHGGRINVSSAPGQGSVFEVELPRAPRGALR